MTVVWWERSKWHVCLYFQYFCYEYPVCHNVVMLCMPQPVWCQTRAHLSCTVWRMWVPCSLPTHGRSQQWWGPTRPETWGWRPMEFSLSAGQQQLVMLHCHVACVFSKRLFAPFVKSNSFLSLQILTAKSFLELLRYTCHFAAFKELLAHPWSLAP